ncbi:thioredoxin domain-containing protein [Methanobrevibacter arboriphilus]|jgi:uncharacterized protein YyaL (SSP411 family)|uniref:Thioredoxin domain-containing protein n=1 Tax=Methanobrevibacter arboriphilus TaxID=39441 RepID=A0ACA8R1X3_METAZ|nr:thioredoxin domain-containing protein [Methanobrevibacter arboriphilus]BBL61308.1 thioredoxin domain-containing protein [Methanobrevibacter arboriphilus]
MSFNRKNTSNKNISNTNNKSVRNINNSVSDIDNKSSGIKNIDKKTINKNNSNNKINENRKPNDLINETSPYLLQHAYNPVNWHPWNEKSFSLAKKENKPIFLSIGYSTCHWCHVMEKESFEDEEVAKILNENFISIKVDREEMPSVDSMYMESAIIFTGNGGWPLTVLIDNDKKPFFAGTYYPKISLIRILNDISNTWKNDPNKVKNIANDIINDLKNLNRSDRFDNKSIVNNRDKDESVLDYSIIERTFEDLKSRFDNRFGGFGYAPKFPSVQNILFLNRYYFQTESLEAKDMVEKTLDSMFNGGIFDHIAGGFSRYSVDYKWLVPHFEKMMYDNGILAIAYLEAGLLFNKKYLKIAKKILDYCFREMLGEHGFYTAQDADSEGEEGKYYLFTINDIRKVLGSSDSEKFCKLFDITRDGNFKKKNIPNLIKTFYNNKKEYYTIFGSGNYNIHDQNIHDHDINNHDINDQNINGYNKVNPNINENTIQNHDADENFEFNSFIEDSTKKLYNFRLKRTPPFKDKKNLAFVNGLMIATLSMGANILNKREYIEKAEEIGEFIINKLIKDGRLYTSYKDGKIRNKGVLDDYAYVIWGFIELFQVTLNKKWLNNAQNLMDSMIDLFFDDGVLYLSGSDVNDLPIRTKNVYDGAIPSGNNISVFNLMRLYSITNNDYYKDVFEEIIYSLKTDIEKNPLAFITLISGLIYDKSGGLHINLALDLDNKNINKNNNKDVNNIINKDININKNINKISINIAKEKLSFWNPFLTISLLDKDSENFNENMISVCENMTCKPYKKIDDFLYDDIDSKIIKLTNKNVEN